MAADKENKTPTRHTHVMFVENVEGKTNPEFYNSLKEASTQAEEIIKKYPSATIGIYQLRADLKGEVKVIREDFTS